MEEPSVREYCYAMRYLLADCGVDIGHLKGMTNKEIAALASHWREQGGQ